MKLNDDVNVWRNLVLRDEEPISTQNSERFLLFMQNERQLDELSSLKGFRDDVARRCTPLLTIGPFLVAYQDLTGRGC